MKCPHCGGVRSRVENTTAATNLETVQRYRRCLACRSRFRTHEVYVPDDIASELRYVTHDQFLRILCEIRIKRRTMPRSYI